MAKQAKAVLKTETLDAVADHGYFNSLGYEPTSFGSVIAGLVHRA